MKPETLSSKLYANQFRRERSVERSVYFEQEKSINIKEIAGL